MKANSAKRAAQSSKLKICALSFALCALSFPLMAEPLDENQSRFGVITGDVGLLTQGAEHWIEPHEGLPLEPGDHIRTGEDGTVELVMSDNALWIVQPKTDVVVEHTEVNAGHLDLADGRLIGKVDSQRTAGTVQDWEFDTPAAVVAIRGTEFGLTAAKQEGTHLGVFEGKVDFQPAETAAGPQPVTEVPSGHETVASRGRPIQTFTKFTATMSSLASLRQGLRSRQKVIQNTWSPFTPTVRKELRRRFVSVPPKRHYVRRVAPRKPHHETPQTP
jgi:hypothetical protein